MNARPMPLVLATHNAHKVTELRRILGGLLDGIDLLAYGGPEPVEDGESFEANALIKARAASKHTGFAAIADDSGIAVAALNGAPGIHSARYAGNRDDTDNVRLLLKNLLGSKDRSAEFLCAAALVLPDGRECVNLGRWPGSVLLEPTGDGGFGYDPVFMPAGYTVSAAQLSPDKKDSLSHRSLAFATLMPMARELLIGPRE